MKFKGETVEVIDVPGTYSLDPTNEAERVAVEMLKQGDLVINVIDATNLERNLYLTLQLLEKNIPVVVPLNFWDETKHTGIDIDIKKLEKLLKIPVVPITAITGEGVKKLVTKLSKAKSPGLKRFSDKQRWAKLGKIIDQVQNVRHKHHTFLERLGDASVNPFTGVIIALIVLFMSFEVIRFIGEGLINYVFEPLFSLYTPLMMKLSGFLGQNFVHDILIGALINGEIEYSQSMGLLTTGLYVPIVMVLPYVFSFYLVLGFLEDSGYLPRLAIMVDNVMHKLGLHGFAIIPMLLGLGCNVPGALATRVLESKRQKFIAATLMAIAIPCMAQIAMIIGLVGKYGASALWIVFSTLFMVWLILGLVLNKFLKGGSPELFLEIPPYRCPYLHALLKKLWMRTKGFLKEAVPYLLFGVFIINIAYSLGIISFVGQYAAPLTVSILGLPESAVGALVAGFLRKDIAVGMLLPLSLSVKQAIIASVVLAMYFPCIATFVVLIRELGIRGMVKSTVVMLLSTLIVGLALNIVL
jgi:ferrous iron transport protein B